MANEINYIVKQFEAMQHGDCWIGTNFKETLKGVDHEKAMAKKEGNLNNIWMLVAHITYWRTTVVNRLTGSDNPPPFSDFHLPDETTAESWHQALHDFEGAYHLLRNAIHHFNVDNLHRPSIKKDQTNYELILGCLQHDAYHFGQIMLLKKGLAV